MNESSQFNASTSHSSMIRNEGAAYEWRYILPLYVIIFVLSVTGNCLVIATLAQNRRMRTVTNVYLLNLAVSDLLLGVFCLPFTLVGQLLRRFIFGAVMCKLVPYFQVVSVSVDVLTLVAISLERYFAICRPLKSRRWQTRCHAYKMITLVWFISFILAAPILHVSTLQPMRVNGCTPEMPAEVKTLTLTMCIFDFLEWLENSFALIALVSSVLKYYHLFAYKYREIWTSGDFERLFNLILDCVLLLLPLLIMTAAYSLIVSKLWRGMKHEIQHTFNWQRQLNRSLSCKSLSGVSGSPTRRRSPPTSANTPNNNPYNYSGSSTNSSYWMLKSMSQEKRTDTNMVVSCSGCAFCRQPTNDHPKHVVRSTHTDRSIEAKRKVIRMLFVIILEFFICWAPIHVINTVYLFYPEELYFYMGRTGIAMIQLLAFCSSCCNPITYCFMNKKFRQAFISLFRKWSCCGIKCSCDDSEHVLPTPQVSSHDHNDMTTVYMQRASARTELDALTGEECV